MAHSQVGYVERPLDALFQAPSHLAILRVLRHQAMGVTGREIARSVGITHKAVHDSLARLEWVGVICRRAAGRAYLFSLNRNHWLVKRALLSLFEREQQFGARIRDALKTAFESSVISGVIFGSIARKEDEVESDFDLCLVVADEKRKGEVASRISRQAKRFSEEFGLRLAPLLFLKTEVIRGYREQNPFFLNVVREGERFVGQELSEVVGGQKNKASTRQPRSSR
jgi:predicted nucleotidyltransferase